MGKIQKSEAPAFVLDCSVTLCWFFEDETSAYADSVEDSLETTVAVTPVLWPMEVANALLMGERRGRSTQAKVTQYLNELQMLPIHRDLETATRAWVETLALARDRKLTVYDASYLELAMRLKLPLATLDKPLRAAMKAVGVAEYRPR